MKNYIIAFIILAVVVLIGIGLYFFNNNNSSNNVEKAVVNQNQVATSTNNLAPSNNENKNKPESVIGKSVEGRNITAYHYGTGDKELLFVGGIHGAYEWNTILLSYQFIDYLKQNPNVVPSDIKVTIIPNLNPDGLFKVVGKEGLFTQADIPTSQAQTIPGRFNANNVDLNRNFDCDWQTKGVWQSKTVSGGTEAFSEPESQAIKKYVEDNNPTAVVVFYSAANGVFASSCHNGVLPETLAITNLYAKATGYPAYENFDFYEITGDMVNWLAKKNIPAISILLSDHRSTEWSKNKLGIEALFERYSK